MSTEVLYYLYSKYSQSCTQLMPTMHRLASNYTIHFIDIDHPQTRMRLRRTDIKSVPCVIVKTDRQLDVVEARGIPQLVNILQHMAQQREAPPPVVPQQPQQTMISSIVDPALVAPQAKQDMSYSSSLNSRLQPTVVSGPPPPQPAITTQIVANQGQPSAIASAHMMANQHHQQTLLSSQPFADPLAMQQQQQQQQQYQPQAPQQQPASGFAGATFIDDVQPKGATFSASGALTPDQITGGSTSQMRMDPQNNHTVSESQRMAREREMADQQMFPQRGF